MEYPLSKIAVLTEGQLIARSEPKRKPAKKTGSTNRQKLNSFTDLTPGDLVVHENYGIGRFVAMEQIKVDGAVKDYIKIAYQGSDTLFVPATQLDLVSKYIGGGGEDSNVKLNKIGSDAWQKTKAKARKAAKDMAGELQQHTQDAFSDVGDHAQGLAGEVAHHSQQAAVEVRHEIPVLIEHVRDTVINLFGNVRHGATRK